MIFKFKNLFFTFFTIFFFIVIVSCNKDALKVQLIQSKIDAMDSAVLFSNDGGKTYIRALLVNGIYYGNVEAGLYYSTNKGAEWALSNIATKIDSIWYVSSFYIAQGKDSIYSSHNGKDFTKLNVNAKVLGVKFISNQVFLLTNKGVFTTTNGLDINATNIKDSVQTSLIFNNIFLIGTNSGLYNLNGTNFNLTNLTNGVNHLYSSNKIILALTDSLYFSTNGLLWKPIIKLNNIYFANAPDSLYVSNDSWNWKNGNLGSVFSLMYKDSFIETNPINGKKYYSSNGLDWERGIYIVGMTYGGLFYSKDGKTFYPSKNPDGTWGSVISWDPKIQFNNIYFIEKYEDFNKPDVPYYSYDGINWNKVNFTFINSGSFHAFNHYFIFNNKMIIVGSGVFVTSDGLNFTKTLDKEVRNIYRFNDIIFVTDYYNNTYYSRDCINWNLINIINGTVRSYYRNISYANNIFFVTENQYNKRKLLYSNNGIDFYNTNLVTPDGINNTGFSNVEYLNGKYHCVSYRDGVYYSLDGITWYKSNFDFSNRNIYYYDDYQNVYLKKLNNTLLLNLQIDTIDVRKSILYYSKNGETWLETNINLQTWLIVNNSFEVNGRLYSTTSDIATRSFLGPKGNTYTSIDAINWYQTTITDYQAKITYDSQRNIYLSNNQTNYQANAPSYSYDGINWNSSNGINGFFNTWPITKANNRLYASTISKGVYFSFNGINYFPTNLTEGGFSNVVHFDE